MTWDIASGPYLQRIRGYHGRVWRWTLSDGERTHGVSVKLTAAAMTAPLNELPAPVRAARQSRGRSQVELVTTWVEPPTAAELCAAPLEPFLAGGRESDDAPEPGAEIEEVARWLRTRNRRLLLQSSNGTWHAAVVRPGLSIEYAVGGSGPTPEAAAAAARDRFDAVDVNGATRGQYEPGSEYERRVASAGWRVVWWRAEDPTIWRVSVQHEDGVRTDGGIGETHEDALARIAADVAPAPGLRQRVGGSLRGRWRRLWSALNSSSPSPKPQEPRWRTMALRFVQWLQSHPTVALSVSGTMMYAVVRSSYAAFYGQFGVQPEEVGLSEARMLGQSAIAWLTLLAGAVLASVIAYLLRNVRPQQGVVRTDLPDGLELVLRGRTVVLPRRRAIRVGDTGPPVETPNVSLMPLVFTYALLIGSLLVVLWFAFQPFSLGQEARDGRSVRPGIANVLSNPLGLRAERARVVPLGIPRASVPADAMYLGEANATSVLYDLADRRTVRVPSRAITVSTAVSPAVTFGPLEPKKYVTDTFSPTASFTIPGLGWSADDESTRYLQLARTLGSETGVVSMTSFVGEKTGEVVERFRAHRGLDSGPVERVDVGAPLTHGTAFEADVKPPEGQGHIKLFDIPGAEDVKGDDPFLLYRDWHVRFVVIQLPGAAVAAIVEAPRKHYPTLARESERLFGTLRLG
jgi:hypothetical protein